MFSNFRVLTDAGFHYFVCDDKGRGPYRAKLSGKLKTEGGYRPAVGDWVSGRLQDEGRPEAWVYVDAALRRKNALTRKLTATETQVLAANVDLLLVLSSLNEDLNLNRLDRYLALATQSEVPVVIGLSKLDLCAEPETALARVRERFPKEEIYLFSVETGEGLEALKERIGRLAATDGSLVLLGSSGVGKSTLSNALLGHQLLKTGGIREDDGRGRHTTTHRSLLRMPGGGWLMDTPGLRGLNPEFSGAGLGAQFEGITEKARACRFRDCRHDTEPGCAVREALEGGELSEEQWASYAKLKKEDERQAIMSDHLLKEREQRRWKKITLDMRRRTKDRSRMR